MNDQIILSVPEQCPVCFNDDITSLKPLNGCGHSLCGDCKSMLKKQNNQRVIKHDVTLVKCPLCRAIEKPTCEDLEKQIERIEALNRYLTQGIVDKDYIIRQLSNQLNRYTAFLSTPLINLVDDPDRPVQRPVQRPVNPPASDPYAFFSGRAPPPPANPQVNPQVNPPTPNRPTGRNNPNRQPRRNNPNRPPLMFCHRTGCTGRNRTRGRCLRCHETPCCSRHMVCTQCRPPTPTPIVIDP